MKVLPRVEETLELQVLSVIPPVSAEIAEEWEQIKRGKVAVVVGANGTNGHTNGRNGHTNGRNGHTNGRNGHTNGRNGHTNGPNGHGNGTPPH